MAEIEASPTKTLARPELTQYPGGNLDKKDVDAMWEKFNFPDYLPILTNIKQLLSSSEVPTSKDVSLLPKAEEYLKKHLAEKSSVEAERLCRQYEAWEKAREEELDRQIDRLRRNEIMTNIESKKKELAEKEDTIFFFDNEEEWMMKLPENEQKGYVLPTEYIASNRIPHVKVSLKNKTPNYRKVPYKVVTPKE